MFEYEIPTSEPYFIMKVLKFHNGNERFDKVLLVVKFGMKVKLLLGRGTNCDIKFNDSTISKFQTYFKLTQNENNNRKLWIQDTSSQFGTLVMKDSPIILNSSNPSTSLSIGKTL